MKISVRENGININSFVHISPIEAKTVLMQCPMSSKEVGTFSLTHIFCAFLTSKKSYCQTLFQALHDYVIYRRCLGLICELFLALELNT